MPALHTLGDSHLILALQQRNQAHFPQIEPDWIVIFVEHPRRKVEFALFCNREPVAPFNRGGLGDEGVWGGASGFRGGEVLVDADPDALESGEQIVNFLLRVHPGGQNMVYFVGEQISALLTHIDEVADFFTHFLRCQRQVILPLAK